MIIVGSNIVTYLSKSSVAGVEKRMLYPSLRSCLTSSTQARGIGSSSVLLVSEMIKDSPSTEKVYFLTYTYNYNIYSVLE